MNLEEKKRIISDNTEEILVPEEIESILTTVANPKHYIGFEISGNIHLGTGILCMSKVRDFTNSGINSNIFLADWHSWINDKLNGDLGTIRLIAGRYFKEGLSACLKTVGGDPNKVNFILGSDLYHNNDDYWTTLMEISKNTTLSRILRSITILGRKEGESVDFAKLIYPAMQAADAFTMGDHFVHAGMDQRKAHVIMREVALKLNTNPLLNDNGQKVKPIAVHHHLLLGLGKPDKWPVNKSEMQEIWSSLKMSKSKPNSAIFILDEPEIIKKKVSNAFCPTDDLEFNPIFDWTKSIIFDIQRKKLKIERKIKYGGDIEYESMNEVSNDFVAKNLHPIDLKLAIASEISEMLKPVRNHFKKPSLSNMIGELNDILSKQSSK